MAVPVELPLPRDWQMFEDFCLELFSVEWGDPEAIKYGRSGEKQNGVDIFGRRDGSWHGVQCKRRGRFPEQALTEAEVRGEVEAAKTQERTLSSLVIATTAPASTALSDLAARLTEDVGFRVEVVGWQALTDRLWRHESLRRRWSELWAPAVFLASTECPRGTFSSRAGLRC